MQILVFILILSLVIMLHEFGHFVAAKLMGVRVEEFGFGFPPKAVSLFRWRGTEFTLNWLPIGGFVRLYGELEEESGSESFSSKAKWQRAFILIAGVVMNFVLAVALFAVVYSIIGVPVKLNGVMVESVVENSPAATAQLRVGEIVKEIKTDNGEVKVSESDKFLSTIKDNQGKEIVLVLEKDGGTREVKVTPRVNPPAGQGSLGVTISDTELRHFVWWQMPFRGAWEGLKEAYFWGSRVLGGFGGMIARLISGGGVDGANLAGPIGIYNISNEARKAGIVPLLQFIGVLSVNLAVLNLMPFPALDGGRVVFLGVELFVGKKWREKTEGWANALGMGVLLLLMVAVTANDLNNIGLFKGIGDMVGKWGK